VTDDDNSPTVQAPSEPTNPPTATNAPADVTPAVPPGVWSSRYVLGDEIASGGMGAVYRPTDAAFGREVAVKVLLDKFAPDSGTARRFHDEARITGQLQHPGIPPAHDLGVLPDGRPFLAMKLIKGETLESKLTAKSPVNVQAVFEAVCQAVAYAHDHGVIHRDLKPANVMVGSFGEVQVMDWGLAKVLTGRPDVEADDGATVAGTAVVSLRDSDGSFTQAGSVLGTPAFMPPEQAVGAVGKVGKHSDVFGLGAILAVILTGKPPFVASSTETTRVQAATGDVAECFARLDACGADPELVALCKRCLSPRAEDRPADAGEVAGTVASLRAAADERARRAELDRVRAEGEKAAAEVRAAEQRRRARLRLFVLGLAAVLGVAGGAFFWYADRQVAAERDRRGRNAEAVGGLLDQAEAALKAGDAARAGPLLDAADARAAEGGAEESAGRREALRADLGMLKVLDRVDSYRWTLVASKFPDPAKVAARYKDALADFGADPDAVGPDPAAARVAGSAVRDRLLAILDYVLWQGQSSAVRATLRSVDPDRFRDAVRDAWAVDRAGAAVAGPGATRAVRALLVGRPGGADQPPGFVAVLGSDPAAPVAVRRYLLGTAVRRREGDLGLLLALGYTYPLNQRDGADERVRWFQAALAAGPHNPAIHLDLGGALADRGDPDGAIVEIEEALRHNPGNAGILNDLGTVFRDKGEWDAAIAKYKEAIRHDPKYATPRINLGIALNEIGDREGAERAYRELIRIEPGNAMAYNNLGWNFQQKGELDAAIAEYQEAIDRDPDISLFHLNLGEALQDKEDWAGAEREFLKAIGLDKRNAWAHNNLGNALMGRGDLDGAVARYKEALNIDEKVDAARSLPQAERLRPLLPRLPGVLAGTDRPATPAEALDFASLCELQLQKRFAAAVRLYDQAFAADAMLAATFTDHTGGHRYNAACDAACDAARAARGDGADSPVDPAERAALRAKALGWLRADLTVRRRQAALTSDSERQAAVAALTHWLGDSDLSATRPGLRRIGMPPAERDEWDRLWADVRSTLAEAKKLPPPPEVAPPPRPAK
jgi:tetratricopeptide (TPR) repeat protein